MTSKRTDEAMVYAITREVLENFDGFRGLHPALWVLTKRDMLRGLSAPIHPGALRYHREAGLVDSIDPGLISE